MCAPWIRPKLPFFFLHRNMVLTTWFCGCAFRKVWEQVIAVGLYQQYDWTLKMDRVIEAWYVTYDSDSLVFLWFVPLISNEWTCRTQRLHFYLLDSKMYCQCHRIPSNCCVDLQIINASLPWIESKGLRIALLLVMPACFESISLLDWKKMHQHFNRAGCEAIFLATGNGKMFRANAQKDLANVSNGGCTCSFFWQFADILEINNRHILCIYI